MGGVRAQTTIVVAVLVLVLAAAVAIVQLRPGRRSSVVMPTVVQSADPGRCVPGVDFLGFSDSLDKQRFADTTIGGLSALVYDPRNDVYYSQTDSSGSAPATLYTLRVPFDQGKLGRPQMLSVTKLRDAAGQAYNGYNFDGEGIALTRAGELLVASEIEPSIQRFSKDGAFLGSLPVPQRFLVAPQGEGSRNETLESLALTSDQRSLFTANEGLLSADGQSDDARKRLRLLHYVARGDGDFAPAEQYYYLTEPAIGDREPEQGVSDMIALSDHSLLALERGYDPGLGNSVRIFLVSLDGAPDVSNQPSLAAPELKPVPKTLLVDLAQCPANGAPNPGLQSNPILDNFEGMTLGPQLPDGRQVLLLQSDNNFNDTQVTRLVALGVRLPGAAGQAPPSGR